MTRATTVRFPDRRTELRFTADVPSAGDVVVRDDGHTLAAVSGTGTAENITVDADDVDVDRGRAFALDREAWNTP